MASESILDYRLRERGAGPPTSGARTESPQRACPGSRDHQGSNCS